MKGVLVSLVAVAAVLNACGSDSESHTQPATTTTSTQQQPVEVEGVTDPPDTP